MKDYNIRVYFNGLGVREVVTVCAPNATEAYSEVWPKLSRKSQTLVHSFEIVSIEMCAHKKGLVV